MEKKMEAGGIYWDNGKWKLLFRVLRRRVQGIGPRVSTGSAPK